MPPRRPRLSGENIFVPPDYSSLEEYIRMDDTPEVVPEPDRRWYVRPESLHLSGFATQSEAAAALMRATIPPYINEFNVGNDRLQRSIHYSKCRRCGAIVEGYHTLCPVCTRTHMFCSYCNTSAEREEIEGNNRQLRIQCCDRCSSGLTRCDVCGDVAAVDDITDDGCVNCEDDHDSSYDEDCAYLYSYSYRPSPIFLPNVQPKALYIGVELETDRYSGSLSNICSALHELSDEERLFYLKTDGSLHNGFEVVTHPATLDYHRKEFPWQDIEKTIVKYGGKSHTSSTCGIHTHINANFLGQVDSQAWLHQTRKVIAVFQRHWENLFIFSRRKDDQWCHNYTDDFSVMSRREIATIKKNGDKYRVVNISPSNTIEIRMWRGTLRYDSFIACLEMSDFLMRYARKTSLKNIIETGWDGLIKSIQRGHYKTLLGYLEEIKLTSAPDKGKRVFKEPRKDRRSNTRRRRARQGFPAMPGHLVSAHDGDIEDAIRCGTCNPDQMYGRP